MKYPKNRFLFVFLIALTFGCQKVAPESVMIPEYPNLLNLFDDQVTALADSKIKKTVILDNQTESRELIFDSVKWADNLAFLKEINPNQPEYVGAFSIEKKATETLLKLKDGERGALKQLSFTRKGNDYQVITAQFHEEKELYTHHREIDLFFKNGDIKSLLINGYQKVILKDTVRFQLKIERL